MNLWEDIKAWAADFRRRNFPTPTERYSDGYDFVVGACEAGHDMDELQAQIRCCADFDRKLDPFSSGAQAALVALNRGEP
jgi:hypothetical protein